MRINIQDEGTYQQIWRWKLLGFWLPKLRIPSTIKTSHYLYLQDRLWLWYKTDEQTPIWMWEEQGEHLGWLLFTTLFLCQWPRSHAFLTCLLAHLWAPTITQTTLSGSSQQLLISLEHFAVFFFFLFASGLASVILNNPSHYHSSPLTRCWSFLLHPTRGVLSSLSSLCIFQLLFRASPLASSLQPIICSCSRLRPLCCSPCYKLDNQQNNKK